MQRLFSGSLLALFAVFALVVLPSIADARFKRGSFGSRGLKTFSSPRATPTAPRRVRPLQQTRTPRSALNANRATTRPGMFGGLSKGGFMAGLLGAGLLGALFGYGLSGGLGGIGAFLGLLLQIALLAFAAMLLFSWLRKRNQPAMARSTPYSRDPRDPRPDHGESRMGRSALGGSGTGGSGLGGSGLGASGPGSESAPGRDDATGHAGRFGSQTKPLATKDEDFEMFERLLTEVQEAYAREDMGKLRRIATGEMCDYLQEDIEENQRQGQASRISGVKLLQGDLSEAWTERDAEYATVAMRFSLSDALVDRKTGQVLDGSLTEPVEMTEIWTFTRQPGGSARDWLLAAVQSEDDED